ncbi:MAG: hypothetical protein SPJ43_03895, partial [Candidatus Cryptobacteroides sp.]|nr:hypothetical protein [Candidatus Cryptobacteroides sp.]
EDFHRPIRFCRPDLLLIPRDNGIAYAPTFQMECRGFAVDAEWVTAMVAGCGCIRYRKRPPTVRNMRAVLKKASCGTRRIFRGIRCKKQASTVQKGYSVPETHFSGTE